jgi:hypothetical protein
MNFFEDHPCSSSVRTDAIYMLNFLKAYYRRWPKYKFWLEETILNPGEVAQGNRPNRLFSIRSNLVFEVPEL